MIPQQHVMNLFLPETDQKSLEVRREQGNTMPSFTLLQLTLIYVPQPPQERVIYCLYHGASQRCYHPCFIEDATEINVLNHHYSAIYDFKNS